MHPRATSYAPAHGAGLTSRPNAQTNAPGEFAMDMPTTSSGFDLEDDVASLRSKVKQLKSMSRRIGEEATIRGDLIDALTIDFSSGDAAMRDVRRKLGAAYERAKGGHLMSLMFFAVLAFLGMFFFVKFNKAIRFLVPRGTGQSVRHH